MIVFAKVITLKSKVKSIVHPSAIRPAKHALSHYYKIVVCHVILLSLIEHWLVMANAFVNYNIMTLEIRQFVLQFAIPIV